MSPTTREHLNVQVVSTAKVSEGPAELYTKQMGHGTYLVHRLLRQDLPMALRVKNERCESNRYIHLDVGSGGHGDAMTTIRRHQGERAQ